MLLFLAHERETIASKDCVNPRNPTGEEQKRLTGADRRRGPVASCANVGMTAAGERKLT